MKLDGKTIANIYLGKIKTWNAPEIKSLNPGVNLPSTAITVIHRSDSSGTTAGFTGFLPATDAEWASKVGEGKDVQWPTGTGAKGNAGVAGAVQQTVGAVGYVEQAYALQHNFTTAAVKNKSGSFIAPSLASTSAAAEGLTIPPNLGIKVKNPAGANAYPITSQTFIVVNKDLCKAGHAGRRNGSQGRGGVPELRPRPGPVGARAGRLRRAADGNPDEVQGSGRRAAVQRQQDRLTASTSGPRIG